MALLAKLFEKLESGPEKSGLCSEKAMTPAAGSAVAAASEPQRNAWTITRGGRPICRMVGAPCTRTEALAEARWRWPDADVE